MKLTAPHVSIVIPVYNCERYIHQALTSILSQSYPSYEVIVVDDGSTDQTRQQLQLFWPLICYEYQPNQGVSSARNRGINLAKGELVAFLDADDVFFAQ
ncbi:glycosyltransferase family 2 protein [Neosynechococcus sphagnicola]|uniref:glycosyltransferase family 2 protein n=1 Tax=Neosynechococcus sphagnicola TaxID=1501145 RepID=UPI001955274A|nr:glycosyltransferase family A protein [Neosynechococcus sphagnicola]